MLSNNPSDNPCRKLAAAEGVGGGTRGTGQHMFRRSRPSRPGQAQRKRVGRSGEVVQSRMELCQHRL
jgi:hypothetical protein